MASKFSSEYTPTNGSTIHDGYIIVDETLFEVEDKRVIKRYDLDGISLANRANCARRKARLDNSETVYYDNEEIYSADDLYMDKYLLTEEEIDSLIPDDEEYSEDMEDYIENKFFS